MKMKSKVYFLTFLVLFAISGSCAKDTNSAKEGLDYTDFEKSLKADMNYSTIVSLFGEPDSDIGSGIHIYVYRLIDSTEVWIGYTDKILYARHVDKDQQLIGTLI
jgi:hypothetical protein